MIMHYFFRLIIPFVFVILPKLILIIGFTLTLTSTHYFSLTKSNLSEVHNFIFILRIILINK